MFEESPSEELRPQKSKLRHSHTVPRVLGVAIVLLVGVVAFLAYKILSLPSYVIPAHIADRVTHTIFTPKNLPSGYQVVANSFGVSEEGGLIFRVEDSSGSSIAFTEQKKPENFDFEKFYKEEVVNAKKLGGTPYPSVIGKAANGDRTLLSIVADDVWIIASTDAPLGEQEFTAIAKGIKRH